MTISEKAMLGPSAMWNRMMKISENTSEDIDTQSTAITRTMSHQPGLDVGTHDLLRQNRRESRPIGIVTGTDILQAPSIDLHIARGVAVTMEEKTLTTKTSARADGANRAKNLTARAETGAKRTATTTGAADQAATATKTEPETVTLTVKPATAIATATATGNVPTAIATIKARPLVTNLITITATAPAAANTTTMITIATQTNTHTHLPLRLETEPPHR
jgi:CBS domain-containing protein